MQTRIRAEIPEKIKVILNTYKEQDIEFNEINDHFNVRLHKLGINKKALIRTILKADSLVFVGISKSKNIRFNYIYDLFFEFNNIILKIPTSIKPKSLYLITIFKIERMEDEAKKYE